MRSIFLGLLFLFVFHTSYSQNVVKIFTDFGNSGFWMSDTGTASTVTRINNRANLLGFTVGAQVFSTGVNDNVLIANNVVFRQGNYRALPLGDAGSTSTSSTFIGIGKNYNNISQNGSAPPPTQPRSFYLTDGQQGLDLATGVFNVPQSRVSYKVDEFSIAAINDGMPDIIANQIGAYEGPADTFRFVDINGVIVGNPVLVNFSNVKRVTVQEWAFYNDTAATRTYNTGVSSTATRDTRLIAWDLSAFGLNSSNVGLIARFVHVLSGTSDQAFIAYNTTSFRALQTIIPSCSSTVAATMWLQANNGVANNASKITEWTDNGTAGLNMAQATDAMRPVITDGATGAFNFNPYVDFDNGKWLGHANSPFNAAADNMDVYIVGRTTGAGTQKIFGQSRSSTDEAGTSRGDYPAYNFTASGMSVSYGSSTQAASSSGQPSSPGVWQLKYTQSGAYTFGLNGTNVGSGSAAPFQQGLWYSRLGDGTPGNDNSDFDLAEIIVFPGNNPIAEQQKTMSYLAIKYGITLPQNYISGQGNVVWDYTAASAYNNRILAIGREDCEGLSQKQSKSSADAQQMLTVGLGAIATTNKLNLYTTANSQFLVWGDNNGSLTNTVNTQGKDVCVQASGRTWRLQRSGDYIKGQNTQVKLHVSEISWNAPGYTTTASNYYLLLDRNANGSYNDAGDVSVAASSLVDGYAIFDNVLWDLDESGTDLFTVGVKRAELPLVAITPPSVCPSNTVDLTVPAITTGSTAGLGWSYFTNAAATTLLNTPTAVPANTYYIKGTSPVTGCSVAKPVVVTNYVVPAVDAGPDFNHANTTFIMAGNVPAVGESGQWTISAVSPSTNVVSINSPSSYNTTVSMPRGTHAILRWTVSDANCSASDDVALTSFVPLPVQLLDFTASSSTIGTQLRWTTTQEHNSLGYGIERSNDGKVFEEIGFVRSIQNADENGLRAYQFVDAMRSTGTMYYRLRQVDLNNEVSYSAIRKVVIGQQQDMTLGYPNPVIDVLNISGQMKNLQRLKVISTAGLVIYESSQYVPTVNLSGMSSGLYYLIIIDASGQAKTMPVMKQ